MVNIRIDPAEEWIAKQFTTSIEFDDFLANPHNYRDRIKKKYSIK